MRKHISFILCFIIILTILPGCGKKKITAESPLPKNSISTSIDTDIDIIEQKEQEEKDEPLIPDSEITIMEPPFTKSEIGEVIVPPLIQQEAEKGKEEKPVTNEPLALEPEEATIEFHFENADIDALIRQMSDLYNVTFISDENISPLPQGSKAIKGNKISFKTQSPLTKQEAWNLFNTFLQIAGFTVIDDPNPRIKRIIPLENARKAPLPAYIGTPSELLPDSDQMIRYVYFVENTSLDTLRAILEPLRSTSSSLAILQELRAFVLTDRSYNIKSLMNIIRELDKVSMPQAMSVLKLKRADAIEVKKLYEAIAQTDEKSQQAQRFFPARRSTSTLYFPETVSIFAEPRTNSLILLGPDDAISRIEDFIIKNIDIELTQPYSPLHVFQLKYADAKTISEIMNEVTKFGAQTPAGQVGGVRGGDKYIKQILFIAEQETNRVIVKGDYDDFLKAKEVMIKLDSPQPQVAIEVLLVSVTVINSRQLGAQLRSREPGSDCTFGSAKFQTSGLLSKGIVENANGAGINRLLGNLLDLLVNPTATAGNTIISLGDNLSVWAVFQALETISNAQVLANPFLVATNKTKATVSLGETRRIVTGTIIGTTAVDTFGDAAANLTVVVTPQINSDGMIILDLSVSLSNFVGAADPSGQNATRQERKIVTKTIVSNNEVLALGGLIRNTTEDAASKVPVLGDIPILGWLFKNKSRNITKENLLILLSPRIIEPQQTDIEDSYTRNHLHDYTDTMNAMLEPSARRDPVHRWFFDTETAQDKAADQFLYKRGQDAIRNSSEPNRNIVTPIIVDNKKIDEKPLSKALESPLKTADAIAPSRKNKKSLVDLINTDSASGVTA